MATTMTLTRVVVDGVTYDCVIDPIRVSEVSTRPQNVTFAQWANIMNCKAALRRESERNLHERERLPMMTFAKTVSARYSAIYRLSCITVTYIVKDDEISFSTTELGEFLSFRSFLGSLERAGVPIDQLRGGELIGRGGTRYYRMSMPCPHDEVYWYSMKVCRGQKPSFYTGTAVPVTKKENPQDGFAMAMAELKSAKDELTAAVEAFKKFTNKSR